MGCLLEDKTLSVTFSSSFTANKGMDIYIMNDASDGKPFDIHSIEVTYSYTTAAPTNMPPSMPSTSPTPYPVTPKPTSPIIIIKPTLPPTYKEGQIQETTKENIHSTTKENDTLMVDNNDDSKLMMYLVIIIVVLLICF